MPTSETKPSQQELVVARKYFQNNTDSVYWYVQSIPKPCQLLRRVKEQSCNYMNYSVWDANLVVRMQPLNSNSGKLAMLTLQVNFTIRRSRINFLLKQNKLIMFLWMIFQVMFWKLVYNGVLQKKIFHHLNVIYHSLNVIILITGIMFIFAFIQISWI